MSNINELQPIQSLRPFTKFCCTIGNLPASYMVSLTYEEQLLWLCDYIKNTVIPTINNNAEAVVELQNLYIQLKNYVDNYFENLDVQNEINNKLDEMAQDGTLLPLIKDALTFNPNDVPTIMCGDSYATGYQGGQPYTTPWCDYLKNKLGLSDTNYYKTAENGAGFSVQGWYEKNFADLLSTINVHGNENKIKRIIICGGYNDTKSNYNTVVTSISNTINTIKNRFPNAEIYIGCIGNDGNVSQAGQNLRYSLISSVLPAYQSTALNNGCHYLNGVENALKDYSLFISDNYHPSEAGHKKLASAIFESIVNGIFQEVTQITSISVENSNINSYSHLYERIVNDTYQLIIDTSNFGIFNEMQTFTNHTIDLGVFNLKYKRATGDTSFLGTLPVVIRLNNIFYSSKCNVFFDINNHLLISFDVLDTEGNYIIDNQSTNRLVRLDNVGNFITLSSNLANC